MQYGISTPEKVQRAIEKDMGLFGGLHSATKATEAVSFKTTISVGRKGPRDKSLDDELAGEVMSLAEGAEELFDSLLIKGVRTVNGEDEVVTLNMLKTRLHREVELPRAAGGGDWPDSDRCFRALLRAKRELVESGELEQAARARPSPST